MRKLLPIFLALIGLGVGVGVGLALRPDPAEPSEMSPCGDSGVAESTHPPTAEDEEADPENLKEYVKLNNQFIVPVVKGKSVQSLIILSVNLEVRLGEAQKVYEAEPKLRDRFLRILFDHANAGGFDGAFTNSNTLDVLRGALFEAAKTVLGDLVSDVLIVDIVRQDN
ncbi:MAG: flagellar basal body-associated FliL family protein [Paracoccaceae bacterium]